MKPRSSLPGSLFVSMIDKGGDKEQMKEPGRKEETEVKAKRRKGTMEKIRWEGKSKGGDEGKKGEVEQEKKALSG